MVSSTIPDVKDLFMSLTMSGRSDFRTFLVIHVGRGSREHPLVGDFIMMRCSSSSEIGEKFSSEQLVSGTKKSTGCRTLGNPKRIEDTLSAKILQIYQ
jgi:hypothetical protein